MLNKLNEVIIKSEIARHEDGQAMVEYGLIVGLVSVVAAAILVTVGTDVRDIFTSIEGTLAAALP